MEMMKPNKYSQAVQELQTIQFSNDFVVPSEIQKNGADSTYICIGVKAMDTADGFSKIYHGKLLTANQNMWNKMQRLVKQGIYKNAFAGIFDKIVILHDPNSKLVKEEPKELAPKQKGKVKELVNDGLELAEIAKELKVDLERVEAYAKTL